MLNHRTIVLYISILLLSVQLFGQTDIPLEVFLNSDGTIRLGNTLSKSIDTQKYEMNLKSDGTPYFIRRNADVITDTADYRWDYQFFLPGVELRSNNPNIQNNFKVTAVKIDGEEIYAGGIFNRAGGKRRAYIAKWNRSSGEWSSLGGGFAFLTDKDSLNRIQINDIEIGINGIYAAGVFDRVYQDSTDNAGIEAHNIAYWNGTKWNTLNNVSFTGTYWYFPPFQVWYDVGILNDIEYNGGKLYVGGKFNSVKVNGESSPVKSFAVWNEVTGNWEFPIKGVGSESGAGFFEGWINAVKFYSPSQSSDSNFVFLGGNFNYAYDKNYSGIFGNEGKISANSIARLNLADSTVISFGEGIVNSQANDSGGNLDTVVTCFEIANGRLYIGGEFDVVNGSATGTNGKNIANLDLSSGLWHGAGELNGMVHSITAVWNSDLSSKDIIAAGEFKTSNLADDYHYIARSTFHILIWEPLIDANGNEGTDKPVYELASDLKKNFTIAGGGFTTAAKKAAYGIAYFDHNTSRWNTSAGSGIGGINTKNRVIALHLSGNKLYAGGLFESVGPISSSNIAVFDTKGKYWDNIGKGTNGLVKSIWVDGNNLWAAGDFDTLYNADGSVVISKNIARWDLQSENWNRVGSGLGASGVDNPTINSIYVSSGILYAGGDFNFIDNLETKSVAKLVNNSWQAMHDGISSVSGENYPGVIYTITTINSEIVVGGYFIDPDTTLHNVTSNAAYMVARFDGAYWKRLDPNFYGFNNAVYAIEAGASSIYAGGWFTKIFKTDGTDIPANHIAVYNGSAWSAMSDGFSAANYFSYVSAIKIRGSEVIAGGNFQSSGNNPVLNIAKWDGFGWKALGGGVNGYPGFVNTYDKIVSAMVSTNDNLYLGGYFTHTGNKEADYLSKWTEGIDSIKLTVSISPPEAENEGATVTPSPGKYLIQKGITQHLVAHETVDWKLKNWGGDYYGVDTAINFVTRQNASLVARFVKKISLSDFSIYRINVLGDTVFNPSAAIDGNIIYVRVKVRNPNDFDVIANVEFLLDDNSLPGENDSGKVRILLPSNKTIKYDYVFTTDSLAYASDGTPALDPYTIEMFLYERNQFIKSDSASIVINPRPVILVHGLWSNAKTWDRFVKGAGSYLKLTHPRLKGFAVNTMKTGELPAKPFEIVTIRQNAKSLQKFIKKIRYSEDAEHIDIVAHSMGGLISRHYITSLMKATHDGAPVVNKLIMLGTPNMGSACAYGAIGLYGAIVALKTAKTRSIFGKIRSLLGGIFKYPRNLYQLTPSYVNNLFNPNNVNPFKIPFYILAGNNIINTCAANEVGDGVVNLSSALASGHPEWISFDVQKVIPIMHTSMTKSDAVYYGFVKQLLTDVEVPFPNNSQLIKEKIIAKNETKGSNNFGEIFHQQIIPLGGNETQTITIPINSGDAMHIMSFVGRNVTTEILSPDGIVADKIDTSDARSFEIFRNQTADPVVPGDWKFRIKNNRADSALIFFWSTIDNSDFNLTMKISKTSNNGIIIKDTVSISGQTKPADSVKANVIDSRGQISFIDLFDDGNHNDGAANDGIYSGTAASLPDGKYALNSTAYYSGEKRFKSRVMQLGSEFNESASDLSLDIFSPVDSIGTNDNARLIYNVENNGPAAAKNISMNSVIPSDFQIDSVYFDTGTIRQNASSIVWNIDSLKAKTNAILNIIGKFTASGAKEFSGSVFSATEESDSGDNTGSFILAVDVLLGLGKEDVIPSEFKLYYNYPNPFNPSTNIRFDIPEAATVKLEIYNILGQKIASPIHKEMKPGRYTLRLNLNKFASGIYLARIQAGKYVKTIKIMLLK